MKTDDKNRAGLIFLEQHTGSPSLTSMLRLKAAFVVCWTALWLVAAMHCPLETLGVLANDYCCLVSPAGDDHRGGSTKAGCSYEESAQRLISRTGEKTLAPFANAKACFQASTPRSAITVIERPRPANEAASLPGNWQFHWRTALAPRAPSPLA